MSLEEVEWEDAEWLSIHGDVHADDLRYDDQQRIKSNRRKRREKREAIALRRTEGVQSV